jgi:hypothetical protein
MAIGTRIQELRGPVAAIDELHAQPYQTPELVDPRMSRDARETFTALVPAAVEGAA